MGVRIVNPLAKQITFPNGINLNHSLNKPIDARDSGVNDLNGSPDRKPGDFPIVDSEDSVSGILYDMLQKEVIGLRKASHEKDQSLKDKDDAIEMLGKNVDTLTKAMEVEAKKMRREVAVMEKEVAAMCVDKEHENDLNDLVTRRFCKQFSVAAWEMWLVFLRTITNIKVLQRPGGDPC
ncbi:hypothetical protein MKX01_020474 [Papaver californicum]|nr:hypothetical protein MKX01_020474 [Papaver californicum]